VPARVLTFALFLAAAPLLAQSAAPQDSTAARIKAFPAARSVEAVEAYQPAEVVRGRPRPLALATASGIAPAALAEAQAYADAQKSFGLIVLRDGKIAYERYALGFSAASRFSTASTHKTVMALAMGAANVPLDARVDRWLTEWRGDPRGAITVRQLLTMSSGLQSPPFSPDPAGPGMQLTFGSTSRAPHCRRRCRPRRARSSPIRTSIRSSPG
jgi:CubicO group peptidase (beta-lactamase class C family)